MNVFHRLLVSALLVAATTNFVWAALTYFVYLETQSVISTGLIGGIYLVIVALSGVWFGSFVDRNKKKHAMFVSSVATLLFFVVGFFCVSVGACWCVKFCNEPLSLDFFHNSSLRSNCRLDLFHCNTDINYNADSCA